MKRYFFLPLCLFYFSTNLIAQTPTNNPYLDLVTSNSKHWTRQLPWEHVVDASKVDHLIGINNAVDSLVLAQTIKSLEESGGGVLYFPTGEYFFTYDVSLPSGIILRGVPPEYGNLAIDENAYLGTRFTFPRFSPGGAVFVSSDFDLQPGETCITKRIQLAHPGVEKVALVHLNINRAIIDFSNKPLDVPVDPDFLKKGNKDILLLGLRINNASVTDPGLPTVVQVERNQGWQRWPWKYGANINVTARRNVVITDCMINNKPTDSYRQNNYIFDDGMTFDGYEAEYKVTDHPAIALNYPYTTTLGEQKAVRSMEVVANRIALTKGNEAIVGWASPTDNDIRVIEEKQNVIIDGRSIEAYDYNLLYNNDSLSKALSHTNAFGYQLDYRLVEPEKTEPTEKYPLVLFLHDYTSKGTDNRSQLRHFIWQLAEKEVREEFPCYIIAPQLTHQEDLWRARYNFSYSFPLQVCDEIIDEICEKYPIDRDRIYLIGIGVGGDAVWDMVVYNPNKYAALANIGGYYHFNPISAQQVAHLPAWMIWGDSDEWIPEERKRLSFLELRLAGAKKVKTLNLPRTGKKCWNNILEEVPEFLPWLFDQRRDPSFSLK